MKKSMSELLAKHQGAKLKPLGGVRQEFSGVSVSVKGPPPPPSVIQMIETVLTARADSPSYFRPSMLGGCKRQNVLHYLQAPSNPSKGINGGLHRILDTGTALHTVIQKYLSEHPGIFFVPEVPIWYPTLGIKGHSDGLIIRRSDGYKFCLEIKTTSQAKFDKMTRPEPKHVTQVSVYARLMGVPWAMIVYWSRDRCHMREFPVQAVSGWEEVEARVKLLRTYVDNVADPKDIQEEEMPDYDDDECQGSYDFCGFSEFCCRLRGVEPPQPGGRGFGG